jgi:hypothetical protein
VDFLKIRKNGGVLSVSLKLSDLNAIPELEALLNSISYSFLNRHSRREYQVMPNKIKYRLRTFCKGNLFSPSSFLFLYKLSKGQEGELKGNEAYSLIKAIFKKVSTDLLHELDDINSASIITSNSKIKVYGFSGLSISCKNSIEKDLKESLDPRIQMVFL